MKHKTTLLNYFFLGRLWLGRAPKLTLCEVFWALGLHNISNSSHQVLPDGWGLVSHLRNVVLTWVFPVRELMLNLIVWAPRALALPEAEILGQSTEHFARSKRAYHKIEAWIHFTQTAPSNWCASAGHKPSCPGHLCYPRREKSVSRTILTY